MIFKFDENRYYTTKKKVYSNPGKFIFRANLFLLKKKCPLWLKREKIEILLKANYLTK